MSENLINVELNPDTNLRSDKVQNPNIAKSVKQFQQLTKPVSVNREPGSQDYFQSNIQKDSKYFKNIPVSAGRNPEELRNYLGANQSWVNQAGNSAGQILTEVTLGTIAGVGYFGIGKAADYLGLTAYLADVYNVHLDREASYVNGFTQLFDELKQETNQNNFQIYRRTDQTDFSGWMFENLPSVASTVTLMIPSMAAMKAISLTGKAAIKLGKTSGRVMQAEKLLQKQVAVKNIVDAMTSSQGKWMIQGLGQAGLSRYAENLMEAESGFAEIYYELRDPNIINPKTDQPYTVEEARMEASRAAEEIIIRNSAMFIQDAAQYLAIGKIWNPASKRMVSKKNFGASYLPKKLETFVKNNPRLASTIIAFGAEGFEEGYQFFSGEEAKYNVRSSLGLESSKSFGERMGNYITDHELWTSVFFGGLGGALFSGIGPKAWDMINSDRVKAIKQSTDAALRMYPELFARHVNKIAEAQELNDPDKLRNAILDLNESLTVHALQSENGGTIAYDEHIKKLEQISNMDGEQFDAFIQEFAKENTKEMSLDLFKQHIPEMIEQSNELRESVFEEYGKLEKYQDDSSKTDATLFAHAVYTAFAKNRINHYFKSAQIQFEESEKILENIKKSFNTEPHELTQRKIALYQQSEELKEEKRHLMLKALYDQTNETYNEKQTKEDLENLGKREQELQEKLEELSKKEKEFSQTPQGKNILNDDARYFQDVVNSDYFKTVRKANNLKALENESRKEYSELNNKSGLQGTIVDSYVAALENAITDLNRDAFESVINKAEKSFAEFGITDEQRKKFDKLVSEKEANYKKEIIKKLKKLSDKESKEFTKEEQEFINNNLEEYNKILAEKQAAEQSNVLTPLSNPDEESPQKVNTPAAVTPKVENTPEGSPSADVFGFETTQFENSRTVEQIEADRKAKLDKANERIEKIERKGDSAIIVKIEYYDTIDSSGEKVRVEIQTYKDGRRVLKSYIIEKDGSINTADPYVNERINNKAQLELTNEGLIKGYIGNEENALTKVNEDLNPNQTYIDKINAKYDALRDAELAKQKAETKAETKPNVDIKAVEAKIQEVIANKEFIKLSEDGKSYVNTKTGQKYKRVSDVISEEKIDSENELVQSSLKIGTKVDELVRDFFAGELKDLSQYDVSSKAEIENFLKQLEVIKDNFEKRGETVLANDIVLYNDALGIAGTVDLLTYDTQGNIRIYDMKTMRGNNFIESYGGGVNKYESNRYGKSKKQKHTEQLSLYRILLNNTHGLKAKTLGIMPIEIAYNAGDSITTKLNLLAGVKLNPLDKVKNAELKALEESDRQEVVTDAQYKDFIDKGIVSQARIEIIAEKIKNNESLTPRELEIFTDKTAEINAELKALEESTSNQSQTSENVVKGVEITYTPKGKQKQTYTVDRNKIFNSKGKEVFKEDSSDRRKIFANLAVKQGRADVVTHKNKQYVVNNKGQILSTVTGKIMEWAENNSDRKEILAKSKVYQATQTTTIETDNQPSTKGLNYVVGSSDIGYDVMHEEDGLMTNGDGKYTFEEASVLANQFNKDDENKQTSENVVDDTFTIENEVVQTISIDELGFDESNEETKPAVNVKTEVKAIVQEVKKSHVPTIKVVFYDHTKGVRGTQQLALEKFLQTPKNIEDYDIEFEIGDDSYNKATNNVDFVKHDKSRTYQPNEIGKYGVRVKFVNRNTKETEAVAFLPKWYSDRTQNELEVQKKELLTKIYENPSIIGRIKGQETYRVNQKTGKTELLLYQPDVTTGQQVQENSITEIFGNDVTVALASSKENLNVIIGDKTIKIPKGDKREGTFYAIIKGLDGKLIPIKLNAAKLKEEEMNFLVSLYSEMFNAKSQNLKNIGNLKVSTNLFNDAKKLGYPSNEGATFSEIEQFFIFAGKNSLPNKENRSKNGLYFSENKGLLFSKQDGTGSQKIETLEQFVQQIDVFKNFLKTKRRNISRDLFKKDPVYRKKILNENILNTDVAINSETNSIFVRVTESFGGNLYITIDPQEGSKIKPVTVEAKPIQTTQKEQKQVNNHTSKKQSALEKLKKENQTLKNTIQKESEDINTACDF